jgi:Icc protein
LKAIESKSSFQPTPPDAAGIISWVHLGDLHMTKAGEQSHLDLAKIVDEINDVFSGSISFVFLPGDVAEDGSRTAYAAVRGELDRLNVPWCAIVGDHDVQEKSFANFLEAMSDRTHYAFNAGSIRFVAMNAFDVPDPGSFVVNQEQLAWVKRELQAATEARQTKVLLLHCYPSDLKAGSRELMRILRNFGVHLIDMGHTHYNEIANDGWTLYSATRSTGQVEEGPVGYSVTNVDGGAVSWKFVELGKMPVVVITSPSDERLLTKSSELAQERMKIRAKFWGKAEVAKMTAHLDGHDAIMKRVEDSHVWEANVSAPHDGVYSLLVLAEDARGEVAKDEIRIVIGDRGERERAELDQDNALGAWPEHGLLGTRLGPNKNGKKW